MFRRVFFVIVGALVLHLSAQAATVTGELRKWHKVTVTFDGPSTSETATPNPFTDYRMNVTFTHPATGKSYVVPGYFAADGNAGETSATSGNKWRVHFAPDELGTWNYVASFRTGTNIAVDLNASAGTATSFNGQSGSLSITANDKSGLDLRAKGRLQYVGGRYLRWAETGKYFVKAGADSPENMLGYVDIDGTYDHGGGTLKTWSAHVSDWQAGDASWKGGKGKGLIGAINYLASEGCNVFSFLTYNAGGDGKDVWPFVAHDNPLRYDCSKLDQWQMVFDHGQKKGMYLHFKTQETENDNGTWGLDGGNVDIERKLYYRELVARFGYHLALNWNLGEENTQTDAQRIAMAQYFYDIDPYHHNVVIHTYPGDKNLVYTPLLGSKSKLTGASLQTDWAQVHKDTLTWIANSKNAGRPWVVANDEQGSAGIGVPDDSYTGTPTQKDVRGAVLWGNLLGGGGGIECYFGYSLPHSDLSCEDYRSRNRWWDYCRHALNFFNTHINFAEMDNANALVGNTSNDNSKYCFAKASNAYVVYLRDGGTVNLNLSAASGTFEVKWYDPRNGGALLNGSVASVTGGGSRSLGNAPNNTTQDWVVLVRLTGTPPVTYPLTVNFGSGGGSYAQGAVVTIIASSPPSGQIFDRWTGDTQYVADVLSPTTSVTMPAASVTVTATYKTGTSSQAVTSLTLINADTDTDIGPLTNGSTLNLATLPTRNLSVRANSNPATVGSVRFSYDGTANYQTESSAPYAIKGDTAGNYNPWTPAVGSHTLTATPYSGSGATGTVGTALTVNFTVIDQTGDTIAPTCSITQPTTNTTYTSSTASISVSGTASDNVGVTQVSYALSGATSGSGNANGTTSWSLPSITLNAGTTTITVTARDATGNTGSDSLQVTYSAPPSNAVISLILINADNDTDIGPLTNGATLDLSTLPTTRLNVRANTNPATVGSVRFAYDANSNFRTENVAPYAFAGDSNGDYYAWTPAAGTHTLTATPFSGSSGSGTVGAAMQVTFTVTGATATALAQSLSGSSDDSDGDGLLDRYELSNGLDPYNADSNGDGVGDNEEFIGETAITYGQFQSQWLLADPQTNTSHVAGKLTVTKLSASLKFGASSERLNVSGVIPGVATGLDVAGKTVSIDVGGAAADFVLDGKGRAKTSVGAAQLKLKLTRNAAPNSRIFAGGDVPFSAKLSLPLSASWQDEGVNLNADAKNAVVQLGASVVLDGAAYSSVIDAKYSAKADTAARVKK